MNQALRKCWMFLFVFGFSITNEVSSQQQLKITKAEENAGRQSSENSTTGLPISHTTETSEHSSDNGRLPLWIRPVHYTLTLQPFINGNRSIIGQIEINLEVLNATDKIVLNMLDIITHNDSCKLVLASGEDKNIQIINQTYDPQLQFYSAYFDRNLTQGSVYNFSMEFRGYLNSKLVGFYLSTYKTSEGEERRLASTQFSPTDARRAFPCFDEPGFKATFDISLIREENMTALSNMPRIASNAVPGQPGWFIDQFDTTLKMSTYIVGFMISDFASLSSDALNQTEFKVWSRNDAINQTFYAKELGPKLLQFLEGYFGIQFPLPKLDMAAIPNFKFSGMENWGLIMYRESAMLYDPSVTTVQSKRRMTAVIAHEIAHMWFGNLVTPNWWSDLWLKEGFANFMGYKAVDAVDSSWKMMDYLVKSSYYSAFNLDSLRSSHPINVEVDHPDRISEIFDDISYNKGASIIRMMQHFLTENVYKTGMRMYLKNLQFRNAIQKDLWHYLTEAWKESELFRPEITVEKVMNSWTLQDGYPIISVARNNNSATLTQKRFLLEGNLPIENFSDDPFTSAGINSSSNDSGDNKTWWVPISYTEEVAPDFETTEPRLWLSPQEKTATIYGVSNESTWIILNVQQAGFYRVNYDNNTWNLLIEQLHNNHSAIHHLNRAQLLDDSFKIARAGLLDYSLPLELAKYIKTETNLMAWSTFLDNYNYIYNLAKASQKEGPFKKYLRDLIIPLYNLSSFTENLGDSYEMQSLKSLAVKWACKIGYEPCLTNAKRLFELWLHLPHNESSLLIGNNVKPTVLCYGIKSASIATWEKTFQAYLDSNVQTEKTYILQALACTEDTNILQRYLTMALNESSGIIKQESPSVFQAVSASTEGSNLAWNVIKGKWRFIIEFFGSGNNALWRILQAPTTLFNSKKLIDELKQFRIDQMDYIGSARQTLEKSLEGAILNAAWMQKCFQRLVDMLNADQL